MRPALPDLPAGIHRHYKGHLYDVKGYAHDSSATDEDGDPKIKVLYQAIQLDQAHEGPRAAVRDLWTQDYDDPAERRQAGVDGFFDIICANPACMGSDGGIVATLDEDDNCRVCGRKEFIQQRYAYLGPEFLVSMLPVVV